MDKIIEDLGGSHDLPFPYFIDDDYCSSNVISSSAASLQSHVTSCTV